MQKPLSGEVVYSYNLIRSRTITSSSSDRVPSSVSPIKTKGAFSYCFLCEPTSYLSAIKM